MADALLSARIGWKELALLQVSMDWYIFSVKDVRASFQAF